MAIRFCKIHVIVVKTVLHESVMFSDLLQENAPSVRTPN